MASEPTPLSDAARLVYAAYRTCPAKSRVLRRSLPETLSRREYSRAWRELNELGLVPASSTLRHVA